MTRTAASRGIVPQSRSRAGYSLTELLVVIALMGSLFAMVALMLHLLLKADQATRHEWAVNRTVLSLDEDFRRDVHRGSAAEALADQSGLQLEIAGAESLRYVINRRGVERSKLAADGSWIPTEQYLLPNCRVSLTGSPETSPQTWSLVVERPGLLLTESASSTPTRLPVELRATLNAYASPSHRASASEAP